MLPLTLYCNAHYMVMHITVLIHTTRSKLCNTYCSVWHTKHYILHCTEHYTLHTALYCTVNTTYFTKNHFIHTILYCSILYYTVLHTERRALYCTHYKLQNCHCTLHYTKVCTLQNGQCTLHNNTKVCTLQNGHCTLYNNTKVCTLKKWPLHTPQ